MAESHIASLISSTPDNDMSWGDDLRGAIETLANTRPAIVGETIGSARLNSEGIHMLTFGPFWHDSATPVTAAVLAGHYHLGLSHVRGGTPDSVSIRVGTGATTSNAYYVMYDMADDGHPSNLAYSWGPFSATTSSTVVTLTGQTTTIVAGMYWCGVFTPTGNGGSPTFSGSRPCYYGPTRLAGPERVTIYVASPVATPESTIGDTFRTDDYDSGATNIAVLMGKDT